MKSVLLCAALAATILFGAQPAHATRLTVPVAPTSTVPAPGHVHLLDINKLMHKRYVAHERAVHRREVKRRARIHRLRMNASTPVQTATSASPAPNTSYEAWAHSYFAVRVANCESGGGAGDGSSVYDGNPAASNGSYFGKWQMGYAEWHEEGGSGYPSQAPEWEQDMRAHMLYEQRGWEPWSCSSLV